MESSAVRWSETLCSVQLSSEQVVEDRSVTTSRSTHQRMWERDTERERGRGRERGRFTTVLDDDDHDDDKSRLT